MTGQDAVNSAKAFNEALELDGVIMTKLDGDARGGAVLSVKAVTGVPIKFIGTGEHLDALQEFHPDRMAGRILGMGDVADAGRTGAAEVRPGARWPSRKSGCARANSRSTISASMLGQTRKLGPAEQDHGHAARHGRHAARCWTASMPRETCSGWAGIIDSMTPDERRNPSKMIDQSRRRRIAAGAGVEPHEVNELVKQFDGMADMMKRMSGMGMRDRFKKINELKQGLTNPNAQIQRAKVGTGKRLTPAERAKLRKQREKEARRRKRESRKIE